MWVHIKNDVNNAHGGPPDGNRVGRLVLADRIHSAIGLQIRYG